MVKKTAVPDAWDDDWESQADKLAAGDSNNNNNNKTEPEPEPEMPQTKAERLARHAETNRKLWESADTRETFHFLEATNNVPLTTSFKPQVKVLSRKPVIAKRDPATGMAQMTLDDDPDGHDGAKQEAQPTPEEIRAKQRRDREEKQRRYEEARAKIFGESAPSSGASSPSGAVTPPRSSRGRGRGGVQRNSNDGRQLDGRRQNNNAPPPTRELYDPGYSPKPESSQGRGSDSDGATRGSSAPRNEIPAIRQPRGPDGSGRGGFGFARRGAKES